MTVVDRIEIAILKRVLDAEQLKGRPMMSGSIGMWESPLRDEGLVFSQPQFIEALHNLFTRGYIDLSKMEGAGCDDFQGDRWAVGEFVTQGEFTIEVNPTGLSATFPCQPSSTDQHACTIVAPRDSGVCRSESGFAAAGSFIGR